jgi:very-short-patch-repair endonuclease
MTAFRAAPSSDPSGHLLPDGEKREHTFTVSGIRRGWAQTARRTPASPPRGEGGPKGRMRGWRSMRNANKSLTKRTPKATSLARQLRQDETDAEFRLWTDLRNRRLNGYKFSRQIPLCPYVADFVCRQMSLIVEVDGSQHAENDADMRRTDWLNREGYSVLRFWNTEVLTEPHSVLETILAVLEGRITERCDATRFYPARTIYTKGTAS